MIIKPTVGRIVWYYPPIDGLKRQGPLAAIVTDVWSDNCVNLAVFQANGFPMAEPPTSVHLVQEGEEAPHPGEYCTWHEGQGASA